MGLDTIEVIGHILAFSETPERVTGHECKIGDILKVESGEFFQVVRIQVPDRVPELRTAYSVDIRISLTGHLVEVVGIAPEWIQLRLGVIHDGRWVLPEQIMTIFTRNDTELPFTKIGSIKL